MTKLLKWCADVDPLPAAFPVGVVGFSGVVCYAIGKANHSAAMTAVGGILAGLAVIACLIAILICTIALKERS